MTKLPNGAERIVQARQKGMRPADMLIVSLVGRVNELNPTIYANPEGEYDWRWLVGLDVCVYARRNIKWKPILTAIAAARPSWLGMYDVDRFEGCDVWYLPRVDDIEKPKNQWRWNMDFLPWTTFQSREFAWS